MKILCIILLSLFVAYTTNAAVVNWTNQFNQFPYASGDTIKAWGNNWGASTWTPTNNGSVGNPILFQWQPGCSMVNTSYPANTVIFNLANSHDWVFDGGPAGGGRINYFKGSNTVQMGCSDNGTTASFPPGTNTYGSVNIVAMGDGNFGVTNLLFANLTMRGFWNRMGFTNAGSLGGGGVVIAGCNNVVSNCAFGEMGSPISYNWSSGTHSNFTVWGCFMTNFNHGIQIAAAAANSVFYNAYVISNWLDGGDMYETKDGLELSIHRDPIFYFNTFTDGNISNIITSHNFIRQGESPLSTTAGTAATFFDFFGGPTQLSNCKTYNNISVLRAPLSWSGGDGYAGSKGNGSILANNTLVGWTTNSGASYGGGGVGFSCGNSNSLAYNNIVIGQGGLWLVNTLDTTGLTANNATCAAIMSSTFSDFNIFNGQGAGSFVIVIYNTNSGAFSEPIQGSLAAWKTTYGSLLLSNLDPHSVTNAVNLNAAFMPVAGDTVATGQGTNLTAFGIVNDYYGNARPTIGNWTIGALENTNTTSTTFLIKSGIYNRVNLSGRVTLQ